MAWSDAERIDRLERQVEYLLRYAGVDPEIAAAGYAPVSRYAPVSGYAPVSDHAEVGAGLQALPELPPASASPEIVALVRDGKPIQAIKMYRQMTGAGLKESKDVIDSLRVDLGLSRRR